MTVVYRHRATGRMSAFTRPQKPYENSPAWERVEGLHSDSVEDVADDIAASDPDGDLRDVDE